MSDVPIYSTGKVGDTAGTTAMDNNYFYYCVQNYDGTSQIWKRIKSEGFSPDPASLPTTVFLSTAPTIPEKHGNGKISNYTIRWRSQNVTRLTLNGKEVNLTGSLTVSPNKITTYLFEAIGPKGTFTKVIGPLSGSK
jgi:hypothetical protein